MKRNLIRVPLLALGLSALAALPALASTTFTIADVGTFDAHTDTTLSDTFGGTGFVGIYTSATTDVGVAGPAFAHVLGLENYNGIFSETEMQVNISGLAGATVTSAILSYNLVDGASGSQGVTVTSYSANGNLAFNQAPPNNLGAVTFTSTGLSANSVDVTTLVQNAVAANQTWLGLYLMPNGPGDNYQYTWTYAGVGANPDSAVVRLTVETAPVPEPTTMIAGALMLLPLGASTLRMLRKKHTA